MQPDSPKPPGADDPQLAELRRAIGRLLDQTSHDFRTPLTVIKEFATLMRDGLIGEVNPRQHDYLDIINDRADDLTAMIDNVLDAGKLDAGLLRLWRQPTDVAQAVRSASRLPNRKAASKKITFETAIEPNLPNVHADGEQFTRILANLAAEALDAYHEPESIRLRAYLDPHHKDVCLDLTIRGGHVELDRLAEIHAAIDRIEPHRGSTSGGTFVRLRLIRRLVDLHLGRIRFEPSAGGETIFRITLPIHDPLRLLDGYLRKSFESSVGPLEADLVAVSINPGVKSAVANVVDEFVQQWTGEDDLAIHVEKHRWLLFLRGDESHAADLLRRIEAAWIDAIEDGPGGLLPRVTWTRLGHWNLEEDSRGLIDRFRAQLAPTLDADRRPTVLLIDDDTAFLWKARRELETEGYRVAVSTDGQTALDEARSSRPDVILVDSHLPTLDGMDLLARLREDFTTFDVPVIFASACSSDESRALEMGARLFLDKPVSPSILADVLARVVDPPLVDSAQTTAPPSD
ncbi:MAG: hybrid sensor histidine kinase/response regulator [Pirellulaceae bacterium]|nr:hybrid sensor histidine kinase/response regulator [Pirellulaceae bacterium]